jgi:glycine dehydrogenase subunit 2
MSLGAEGLRQVSETSIINTNYLIKKISNVRGVSLAYPSQKIRLEEARFSLQELKDSTGVGTEDVARRMVDYGITDYFRSHHPWIVREPFIPEPTETFSKEDIDTWVQIIRTVCEEAYSNPDIVKMAPHNQTISKIKEENLNDPSKWAMTWRAYLKKHKAI